MQYLAKQTHPSLAESDRCNLEEPIARGLKTTTQGSKNVFKKKKKQAFASKQVEAGATKPAHLSSIPGTIKVEGEKTPVGAGL